MNFDLIEEFKKAGALLEGHFILSSGLHSKYYLQCALMLQDTQKAELLGKKLVEKLLKDFSKNDFDVVVAPAMGGLVIGHEVARALGKKSIFCERVDGKFTLRRGFTLNKNDKVLIVEDILTTGKSSKETINCVESYGADVIAECCLINRSVNEVNLGKPLISLEKFPIESFSSDNLPHELQNKEAVKPGSRFIKK